MNKFDTPQDNCYILTEIGFDSSYETEETLIEIAQYHCEHYEEREKYLPIDTFEKAIKYFKKYGFTVEKMFGSEFRKCVFCEDVYDLTDMHETDIGFMCDSCLLALKSRGETISVVY